LNFLPENGAVSYMQRFGIFCILSFCDYLFCSYGPNRTAVGSNPYNTHECSIDYFFLSKSVSDKEANPTNNFNSKHFVPHAGSRVVRMDPLRFLAGCCTRRLNQAYHILACCIIVLWFIRSPFYVLLVFIAVCSVFWLFWLSCHYLPSDWLERPL